MQENKLLQMRGTKIHVNGGSKLEICVNGGALRVEICMNGGGGCGIQSYGGIAIAPAS